MTADRFVDEYLLLGEEHRCPLLPFRERCMAVGLTTRQVLAEIRSRYGNGSSNPDNFVASPWMQDCRLKMPDGSRPRGYEGFAFKDMPQQLPPFVEKLWSSLPFRGPVEEFPIPDVTPQQLAGACKSRRIAMVRQKDEIWIVRDCDPEYGQVLQIAKCQREERRARERRRYDQHHDDQDEQLSPMTRAIWPHLPFRGNINEFPIRVSVNAIAGACKTGRIAMIRRRNDVWIVRDIDSDYDNVCILAKDRRSRDGGGDINNRKARAGLWKWYLKEFPHPN